jgi:multiple sugar transport system ATP-binding protein
MPKAELRRRVDEAAALLGLSDLMKRRPAQLSGGQRQRVAMGRAIVRKPTAFLMDEPLSNLDAKLRVSMRGELTNLHARLGVTTVYVTHDQVEAMTLGQRVAVLEGGTLQQVARPQELYRHPANLFVATFMGSPSMNVVEASVEPSSDGSGGSVLRFGQFSLNVGSQHVGRLAGRERVIVGIRPEALSPAGVGDSSDVLVAVVDAVEALGTETHVFFAVDAPPVATIAPVEGEEGVTDLLAAGRTRFVARLGSDLVPRVGEALPLRVDVAKLYLFDATDGFALPEATAR